MRFARTNSLVFLSVLLLFLTLSLEGPALSQQSDPASPRSSPQALALLQKSLAAVTGAQPITDVTLAGTARRIAGSDDESGSATVRALAGTGARIDLSLSSGPRSELRNTSSAEPVGAWSGPDGLSHPISNHNLLTDPGWFPAFALSSLLSAPNVVISYVGPETHDGQPAIHITTSHQFSSHSAKIASLMQHLTQTEIFLDPNTNLPIALGFNTHPDNDAGLDLRVEIRFSDYRPVNGAQIPFRVQKFLNNTFILDLEFQSAALNSGVSASLFSAQ